MDPPLLGPELARRAVRRGWPTERSCHGHAAYDRTRRAARSVVRFRISRIDDGCDATWWQNTRRRYTFPSVALPACQTITCGIAGPRALSASGSAATAKLQEELRQSKDDLEAVELERNFYFSKVR